MNYKSVLIFIVFTLAYTQSSKSQCISINLIKNPDLEEYTCCPNGPTMISCARYWTQPFPGNSTSEYLNLCGIDSLAMPSFLPFFQHAYFGNGYAGICTFSHDPNFILASDYREYIQGTLSEPLSPGQCYYGEFWVEIWNWKHQVPYSANDALGIFFSDTLPQKTVGDEMHMLYPSQVNVATGRIIADTSNWEKISGYFVANGGEKFFTVGNFKQISEINSIYFGSPQFDRSYYFFDNFSLCPCEDTIPPKEPEPVIIIPNIFTPNGDGHNDVFYTRGQQIESFHLMVYNRWGEKVFENNDFQQGWDGTYKGQKCGEGVFFYVAEIGFTNGKSTTKKGSVTLVR